MSTPLAKSLDVVELRIASGRWPAGTTGTVVETYDSAALVEITDDDGHTLELLTLPFDALRVCEAHQQGRLAV